MRIILIGLMIYTLSLTNLKSQHTGFNGISSLKKFRFNTIEKKLLPGKTPENAQNGAIGESDIIGNLGLVSLFYQNGCYTDGQYNHNNFQVEKGEISDDAGKVKFEAYRIYEPTHKASNFLASKHNLCLKFNSKQDYSVYRFDNDVFRKVADVKAVNVKTQGFTKIESLTVSEIKGYSTFLAVPANTQLGIFNPITDKIEAAKINQTPIGDLYKFRFSIDKPLFDNVQSSFSKTRHYFCFDLEGNKTGIIWQETANTSIHLTTIDQSLNKFSTINLPNNNNGVLAAACGNNKGAVFYVTIYQQEGNAVNAMINKQDIKAGTNVKNKLDVSSKSLNMYAYGSETASLNIKGDSLLLMIARTMHQSSDGLNHQGGIAVLFDAKNLGLLKNYGQTSGHSFDNYLMVSTSGDFIGMDLGDNYPRGINLHRFSDYMKSLLVYTFKTKHGETADCWGIKTFPVYPEISTATKKYYKWSNDNNTYTNLGAVIESSDGFVVSFLGEPDKNGKSINNSEAGADCSMNLGFVKVKKNFYSGADDIFISNGTSETGGFFTFGGRWQEQKNAGIVWLTKYRNPATETTKNLKTVKLANDKILFLWELWAGSEYKKTLGLKTDKDGIPMGTPVELGSQLRLDRRDDLLVKGNQVLIVTGNGPEQKLELTIINVTE